MSFISIQYFLHKNYFSGGLAKFFAQSFAHLRYVFKLLGQPLKEWLICDQPAVVDISRRAQPHFAAVEGRAVERAGRGYQHPPARAARNVVTDGDGGIYFGSLGVLVFDLFSLRPSETDQDNQRGLQRYEASGLTISNHLTPQWIRSLRHSRRSAPTSR